MAVFSMVKVHIIGHKGEREKIIDALHRMGVLEITDIQKTLSRRPLKEFQNYFLPSSEGEDLSGELQKIEEVINFLHRVEPDKGGLVKARVVVREKEAKEIIRGFDYREIIQGYRKIEEARTSLSNRRNHLRSEREKLLPWKNLRVKIEDLGGTEKTSFLLAKGPLKTKGALDKEIATLKECYGEVIQEEGSRVYLLLVFWRDKGEKLREILKGKGFEIVELPSYRGRVQEVLKHLDREERKMEEEERELGEKARELARYRIALMVTYDHLFSLQDKRKAQNRAGESSYTFILEGWMREKDLAPLKETLSREAPEVAVVVTKPGKGENPPVELENRRVIQPFHIVTRLYGLPRYMEIDPTPFLAPFFIFFFGLCLTDAGYGIFLLLLVWILNRKLQMEEEGKRFVKLIFLGGLTTIFWGALMGGWFGFSADKFPSYLGFLKKIQLFNPLEDPLRFFFLALVLGVIQVWAGIVVNMYARIKEGKVREGILDNIGWLIIFLFAPVTFLSKTGKLPLSFYLPSLLIIGLGGLLVILFKGRGVKNPLIRLFVGLLSLLGLFGYSGAVSYMGDIISYARLFALGLATGALASAINEIAKIFFANLWVGILLIPLIILAHIFNMAINAMGAFIHSLRLQYVEFFGKFFQGGGRPFRPFALRRKYTEIM